MTTVAPTERVDNALGATRRDAKDRTAAATIVIGALSSRAVERAIYLDQCCRGKRSIVVVETVQYLLFSSLADAEDRSAAIHATVLCSTVKRPSDIEQRCFRGNAVVALAEIDGAPCTRRQP